MKSVPFLGRLGGVDLITLEGGSEMSVSRYVRTSVRPQEVFPISMKFGMLIEVDD